MLVSIDKTQLELIHTDENGREYYRVKSSQGYSPNHFEFFTVKGETMDDWNRESTSKHLGIYVGPNGGFECRKSSH